jgi:translocation protein SEC63
MHPDRGGNEDEFKELVKAFKSLTDNETRRNWEEYGNPDGPGVTHFGIALPKWMVDDKNSIFVLGVYVVLFMIIMPTVVGLWWYKSIKYTSDKIFIITAQMYWLFLNKKISMTTKRALMILGASFEFDRNHNPEIVDRVSDNVEIPQLIKELTEDIQIKNREQPLCWPHSVKARALIHAHLEKLDLPKDTLLKDKNYVAKRCPYLINEMVNILTQAVGFAHASGTPAPKLETIECVMKLSPMIVQALSDKNKNSLLQLPHIEESNLKHFLGKKRNILNIRQFVATKDSDRRSILRNLTDEQYDDIMKVCEIMPYVRMTVKSHVLDDEDDNTITAGALVTLTISLHRQNLKVLFEKDTYEEPNENLSETTKPLEEKLKSKLTTIKHKKNTEAQNKFEGEIEDDSSDSENVKRRDGNDDDFIVKFQQQQKKREKLETKEKISHRVFCPYFPDLKQECWWLYVADRKNSQLISAPVYICTLKDKEELEIKFSAPKKVGVYTYTVTLRSDSYFDFDVMEQVKVNLTSFYKILKFKKNFFL